jgi:hypothetical protein
VVLRQNQNQPSIAGFTSTARQMERRLSECLLMENRRAVLIMDASLWIDFRKMDLANQKYFVTAYNGCISEKLHGYMDSAERFLGRRLRYQYEIPAGEAGVSGMHPGVCQFDSTIAISVRPADPSTAIRVQDIMRRLAEGLREAGIDREGLVMDSFRTTGDRVWSNEEWMESWSALSGILELPTPCKMEAHADRGYLCVYYNDSDSAVRTVNKLSFIDMGSRLYWLEPDQKSSDDGNEGIGTEAEDGASATK